jgi:hypothetical protein
MERELWMALYRLTRRLDKPWGSWRYSAADVLAIYYWAVVHDRPTSWAASAEAWPDELRPARLPPVSTLYRRLRRPETVQLMTAAEQCLLSLLALAGGWVHFLDGKPLTVSAVSKDPDAGYGYGAGAHVKGYKLHAIWGRGPMPLAWVLAAMNVSEKRVALGLLADLPGGGYLVADCNYDVGYLYDRAAAEGFQLVAQKTRSRGRGGLGHRRQSPARLRSIELLKSSFGGALYKARNAIESRFGSLTSFGGGLSPLPAWVRRFHRVRNWVQTKIILSGLRWILIHEPTKLADA